MPGSGRSVAAWILSPRTDEHLPQQLGTFWWIHIAHPYPRLSLSTHVAVILATPQCHLSDDVEVDPEYP